MADVLLTSNTTTNIDLNNPEDIYFLSEGVLHTSTSSGAAITLSGANVERYMHINGTVMDFNGSAIIDSTIVDEVVIFVSQTGSVQTSAQYRVIDLDGDLVQIANYGEIVGGQAARLDGDNNEIYNAGVMGGIFGISPSTLETIMINGDEAKLVNAGQILGEGAVTFAGNMVEVNNSGDIVAQEFGIKANTETAGAATISNSGVISVVGGVAYLGSRDTDTFGNTGTISGAMTFSRGADELRNSGIIQGNIVMGDSNDTDADILVNSGTIDGDLSFSTAAIYSEVRNSGLIDGDVLLYAGNDMYTATGTGLVTGVIDAGAGNDTVVGGSQDDRILGETGSDLLRGGAGDDEIDGGDDADTIEGGNGNDEIFGSNGSDQLFGGAGEDTLQGGSGVDILRAGTDNDLLNGGGDNDFLFGNAGEDTLNGSTGDDVLRGGSGADEMNGGADGDRLFGGAGDDLLIGGAGRDVMRGNAGADTFVYLAATDSTLAEADRIRDFQQGLDRIDISEVEDFTFISDSVFSGTQAEVRFQTTASGLRFEMDVDGNGTVDMRVNMNNVSTLTQDDFIL